MTMDPSRTADPPGTTDPSWRVWTIPNLISFARLVGVPLFLYLFLVAHTEVTAVVVLAVGGSSDWVDGYLARRLHQVSRLGTLLDPLADRLYVLATLLALSYSGVLPWLFTGALLLRELALLCTLPILRRYGYGLLPVHYLGKTATFILLSAFPVILLAHASSGARPVAGPIGWGLAWWGLALYWAAFVLYAIQVAGLVRAVRATQTAAPA